MAARSIIRSLKSLESASLSLLQNESIDVRRTGVREVDHAIVVFETARNKILDREERHTLLVNELNHRVKNLFAIMGGIVSLSARSAATSQELAKAIRGRLDALARAHELILPMVLGSNLRRSTSFDALLRAILMPYTELNTLDEVKVFISGPAVGIGDKAATSLALVIHELATNAAKYGALLNNFGRLDISWVVDGASLRVIWLEIAGRPGLTVTPSKEGFGSVLVERSVKGQLGGELLREWQSDGLRVTLIIPLEHLNA